MFKKSLLTALVLGSLGTFAASAFAADSTAPVCPSADTIKAVQLTTLDTNKHGHGKMSASTVNSFGTDHQWTFSLSGLRMNQSQDLLVKANSVLSTLTGDNSQVASWHKKSNTWVCVYKAEHGFKAKAHTPA